MADTAINPGVGTLTIHGYIPLVVQSYSTSGTDPLLVQTLPRLFPKQTVPFVDQKGLVTNEWYRYLAASLESSTTGVNALDPEAVRQAIEDSRSNVVRLQSLTEAITKMIENNATSQAAMLATVQAVAAVAAPTVVTQANDIPPVQPTLPPSPGGGD